MSKWLAVILCFVASNGAFAKKLIPVETGPGQKPGLEITVNDETGPLARAQVWVESLEGKLIAEGRTDAEGKVQFPLTDSELVAGVNVTATAMKHSAVSVLESVAKRVTFELPKAAVDAYATLQGKLTGFKDTDEENKAMVGLVAKAFEVEDLVQLDSSSFVSPLEDTIDVLGPRKIPSNLVLPDQTFPIYFIPIRVNKPNYRLPILSGSSKTYFGATGLINVQMAVDAFRGGDAWTVVDSLQLARVGVTEAIEAPQAGRIVKKDVVADIELRDVIRMRPGRNTSSGSDTKRLAIALFEPKPGVFVPTDVKVVQSEDLNLTAVERKSAKILDAFVAEKGMKFRGAWLKSSSTAMPDSGISTSLVVDKLDGPWMIQSNDPAQLMIAHLESSQTTSVGSHRYNERWTVVAPRRNQLRLPVVAAHNLLGMFEDLSHASVDLMQVSAMNYPYIDGTALASELQSLEKARKKLQ